MSQLSLLSSLFYHYSNSSIDGGDGIRGLIHALIELLVVAIVVWVVAWVVLLVAGMFTTVPANVAKVVWIIAGLFVLLFALDIFFGVF